MIRALPLIRAGSIVPFVKWLRAEGRPVEGRLRTARLGPVAWADPERPIPLVSALSFLREAAAREGLPDLGCRVVGAASIGDLGILGRAALAGPTPREGTRRVARAMPSYCTHERITLVERPGRSRVLVAFAMPVHQEALHIAHQYTAALIQSLCLATGWSGPAFGRVEMPPHPVAGIEHLRPWFGDGLVAAPHPILALEIADAVFDRPLRSPLPEAAAEAVSRPALTDAGGIAATARVLVGLMLEDGVPVARDLAEAAGITLRTLQRRLAEEATSFSAVLDAARRDRALAALGDGSVPIRDLAADLGFSDQACLTRAVRRWTGSTPGKLRHAGR